jgi:hypothetical protein
MVVQAHVKGDTVRSNFGVLLPRHMTCIFSFSPGRGAPFDCSELTDACGFSLSKSGMKGCNVRVLLVLARLLTSGRRLPIMLRVRCVNARSKASHAKVVRRAQRKRRNAYVVDPDLASTAYRLPPPIRFSAHPRRTPSCICRYRREFQYLQEFQRAISLRATDLATGHPCCKPCP